MSGILLLVPLAAPAHASNASLPVINRDYTYVCGGGHYCDFNFNITNPSSNQYALTAFTMTVPTGWSINWCDWYNNQYFDSCTAGASSAEWQPGSSGFNLPPGATQDLEIQVNYPSGSSYPIVGTLTTTVQDQSSGVFYTGPTTQLISADPAGDGYHDGGFVTVTGLSTSFTAGSSAETITAQLQGAGPVNIANAGIPIFLTQATAAHYGTFSGSGLTCLRPSQCWANTDASGKITVTFQPPNIAGAYSFEAVAGGGYFGDGSYCNPPDCNYYYSDSGSQGYTVVAGSPTSVGYQLSASAFPSIDWLPNQGTTVNMNAAAHTYTGAQLSVGGTPIAISATDRFGNSIAFGAGGITFGSGQNVQIQTASGGLFDVPLLPSTITCGVTAGFSCPVSGSSFAEPFDYYQGSNYGSAGVMTTTITGTYNSATFSVSGSSGTIETSTFATAGTVTKTDHTTVLPVSNVAAGKSITFDIVLGVAQANVPVTVAVCVHTTCSDTTHGYSGTITTASGQTNSTGVYSTSLTVDTKAGHVAEVNATILAPINGTPKHHFYVGPSNDITTVAGSAAKFSVFVGPSVSLTPSPISDTLAGATDYVNVAMTDTYGNPVSNTSPTQIQIGLTASSGTLSATNVYIPTGAASTNGTGSFGPIALTVPSTIGTVVTLSATGVVNGASSTSPPYTLTVVSKSPTLSVFSPKPLSGVIYSNSANPQFRGWANLSAGYNVCTGAVNCPSESMSSLGWKVGSGNWQSTGLAGTNAQWSVITTLPAGLSTVTFNATDSKGTTTVSSAYSVLVDTSSPTITNVTPAGTSLNPGQLFTATIVVSEGDLNATSVGVTYNGTSLASSAITVSGTNSLGNSVTYTVTAALPTGHWSVAVSASTLAGNSATGPSENVTVTVAFGNSITFNTATATYGTVGAYKGVTVSVTNSWSTSQTIVVFATLKSGNSIYVAQGTVTVGAGQTASVFCANLQAVPAGTYSVTFSAVTTSNLAVSAPTTPITVTAT